MACVVNAVKDIDGTKQWVFITLTVDTDEVRYTSVQPWNTNTPPLEGEALEAWCNGREPTYQVEVLKQMFPNARYQNATGDTDFERFTAWVAAGHTNAAYCKGNAADTEETCLADGGTWIPEEVITKVPFTDSHTYTGDMRTRRLESLNTDLQTYLYTKYDVGTQISFQAIETRVGTPEVVKTALGTLFTWISGVMNYYYTTKIAIRDGVDWESVTYDFTTFDATDPDISLEALMGPS